MVVPATSSNLLAPGVTDAQKIQGAIDALREIHQYYEKDCHDQGPFTCPTWHAIYALRSLLPADPAPTFVHPRQVAVIMPPLTGRRLKCQRCGLVSKLVKKTHNPYQSEVKNTLVPGKWCPACLKQIADDI